VRDGGFFLCAKKSGDAEGSSGSGDSSMRATENWKKVKWVPISKNWQFFFLVSVEIGHMCKMRRN
jgi:hypothetical protein